MVQRSVSEKRRVETTGFWRIETKDILRPTNYYKFGEKNYGKLVVLLLPFTS